MSEKRLKARGKKQEARARRSLSLFLLLLLLLMLSLWIQGCQPTKMPPGMQVNVTQVVSGQTIEVAGAGEQPSRVRLVGIEAPDLQQQPWGQAAKQRLAAMINGRNVLLEFDIQEKDAFGRYLAYVWQDSVLLNEQLVKDGYVLWVARSPNHKYDQRLERAQAWARLLGQGIWNPDRPMRLAPAQFRRTSG
jgi:micrococcal nuclease